MKSIIKITSIIIILVSLCSIIVSIYGYTSGETLVQEFENLRDQNYERIYQIHDKLVSLYITDKERKNLEKKYQTTLAIYKPCYRTPQSDNTLREAEEQIIYNKECISHNISPELIRDEVDKLVSDFSIMQKEVDNKREELTSNIFLNGTRINTELTRLLLFGGISGLIISIILGVLVFRRNETMVK